MYTSLFNSSEKEQSATKQADAEEIKKAAKIYMEEHATEYKKKAMASGLSDEEADQLVQEVKTEFEQKALELYLQKAKKVDEKFQQPQTKHFLLKKYQ